MARDDGSERATRSPAATVSATRSATHDPVEAGAPSSAPLDAPSSAPENATFADGALVGNRYRVERFLARGGMGEVYEVTDLELRERVALKTLRRERRDHPNAVERLRREMAYSRRVTHPSVARAFDVGFDETEHTIFLTMEFLAGESLSERIARAGALSQEEAMPIVEQLCSALHAAHTNGIIHRDFKSSNVMLVPRETGGTRAVVTDFGIARAVNDDSETSRLSAEGGLLGSPAYMAPEQVTGGKVTFAADIYALGIVLFEMMTGGVPFRAETSAATALMRVANPPPSARKRQPQLSRTWDAAITRCLAREPSHRFTSALDVAEALRGSSVRPRIPKKWLGIGAAALAMGAGVFALRAPGPLRVAEGRRPTVVVVPFANDGDAAAAAAMTELVATELAVGESVSVKATQDVARMMRDLQLAPGPPDEATRARIRKYTGGDFVVTGRVEAPRPDAEARVRLELVLFDLTSSASRHAPALQGSLEGAADLVARASAPIRRWLRQPDLSPEEAALARATLPQSQTAALAYAAAIDAMSRYSFAQAAAKLRDAIVAEPGFALAHYMLSSVATHLGYEAEAKKEADIAVDLSAHMPREQQLLFKAQQAVAQHKWPDAVEAYRTLHGFFPDDVEHSRRFARALGNAGKADEGLRVVAEARKAPRTDFDDARLDLMEAFLDARLAHHRERLAAALAAQRKADALGATSMRAEALLTSAEAHINLREIDAAERDAREAVALYGDGTSDPLGTASGLLTLGRLAMERGHGDEAEQTIARAADIVRGIGDTYQTGLKLGWLAVIRLTRGHLAAARRSGEEARALTAQVQAKEAVALALNFDAEVTSEMGKLAEAAKCVERAEAADREIGGKRYVLEIEMTRALLLLRTGDAAGARAALDANADAIAKMDDKKTSFRAALYASMIAHDAGDHAEAVKQSEIARRLARDADSNVFSAMAEVNASRLALQEGDFAHALEAADASLVAGRAAGVADEEALAHAARAEALVRMGKREDAKSAADDAAAAAQGTERLEVEARVGIARAKVAHDRGDAAQAAALADAARTRAHEAGARPLEALAARALKSR